MLIIPNQILPQPDWRLGQRKVENLRQAENVFGISKKEGIADDE